MALDNNYRFEKGVKTMEMLRLKDVLEFEDLKPTLWNIRQFENKDNNEPYQNSGSFLIT